MKALKHLFTALLLLCATMATAHDFEVSGIYYNITDVTNKTVAVTYRGYSYSSYSNEYADDVVIPESVTYNGTTYSVTNIGDYAFYDCSCLTSIVIPNSVTSIGSYAFYYCTGLTSIEIPNSVTSIGGSAFLGCSGLTSVEIPNSVTSIGGSAFYYCSGLASIEIPSSVTSIGEEAFYNTAWYNNQPDGVVCAGNILYKYKGTMPANTSIVVKEGTTSIGGSAFSNCSGLTSIEIPNSVTSIGLAAFNGCRGLTSIEIPNSVTSIGNTAFYDCSGLTSIVVDGNNTKYDSRENCNAIIETETNTLIIGCKNTVIPNSVTSIGSYAFYYCTGLTSIEIPNSVTSIGHSAFRDCYSLTSIEIPSNVTSIGDYAFRFCTNLASIEIPNSVTSIGHSAFRDCYSLTSIEIPSSVTSIGDYAFDGCTSLKTVVNLSNLTFSKGSSNNGDVAYYADKVINASNGFIDGDFVWYENESGMSLAGYLGNATELTLPADYNGDNYTIGADAFKDNTTITSIVIPGSVTSIRSSAFSGCSGLTSVEIPNSLTSIGNYAFSGCTGLTSVEFNAENCTSMGDYYYPVFNGCTALSTVTIGENVKTIPSSAFYGCSGLASVVIPNSVTSIGEKAFYNCSALKTVVNSSNLTFSKGSSNNGYVAYYADKVFNAPNGYIDGYFVWYENESGMSLAGYLGNATELTLPTEYNGKSVTSIGEDAFYGCTGLTSVEIPNSVTSIGNSAFKGCNDLETLYIGNSIESIGDEAFANCDRITDIKVALEKPISGSKDIFADAVYDDAILYVPIGAKYRYEKREPWNLFFDIVEMDFTGIDNVKAENGKVKTVYDLQGRKVENPTNGVYIINGKKVLLK